MGVYWLFNLFSVGLFRVMLFVVLVFFLVVCFFVGVLFFLDKVAVLQWYSARPEKYHKIPEKGRKIVNK